MLNSLLLSGVNVIGAKITDLGSLFKEKKVDSATPNVIGVSLGWLITTLLHVM